MGKSRRNRREFLGLAGAGVAGAVGAQFIGGTRVEAQTTPSDARDADLIIVNAKVYTVDDRQPRADAFAVRGGRFIAVGTTADIRTLAGRNTQTFDARQMTVVPG